ncbi:MAG: hypothetical protein KUL83_05950 [Lentimicrobium sp.]|nr:hypothetical protein [Lentimicrobium sp.]
MERLTKHILLLTLTMLAFNFAMADDDSFTVPDSLERKYEAARNDSARVYILVEMSRFYSTSDLKQSIMQAEKAMEIAHESKNKELVSFALFNAGNAYFMQGMYENATVYFYRYLDIQKQMDHKAGIAYALANIGAIRIKMQDYETAKHNLLEGLQILKKDDQPGFKEHIPNILNNLGIVYHNLHRYDSALWYYREGIRTSDYLEDPRYFQASLYNNIGGLFLDNHQADSAYAPLKIAMEVRLERNDLAGQAASHARLGEYHLLIGEPREALHHFYEGMNIAQKIGSIDLQSTFTEKLYAYYKQAGNSDSALKYYELNQKYTQELNNEETVKELTRLELVSEFREKQKVVRMEQDRLNTIYLFTAFLLALLLLVFVLLYFLMHNRVGRLKLEKNNLELSAQNTLLEKENFEKELEIRNKELSTHVMGMIRQNETIGQIVELLSSKLNQDNERFFHQIIRDLSTLQDDNVWDEFEVRYQQVHNEFYEKLQAASPHLTTNERRLCAFLRLNMTTKDISSITGQSIRSIEVARTRLRKKLEISNSDVSLVEFLNSL